MTPDLQDLARALAALPGCRWMPGMLAVRSTGPCYGSHRYTDLDIQSGAEWARGIPDLTDPATAGLVLQMVPGLRMAGIELRASGPLWRVICTLGDGRPCCKSAPTLGEAAARACVAAGRCEP